MVPCFRHRSSMPRLPCSPAGSPCIFFPAHQAISVIFFKPFRSNHLRRYSPAAASPDSIFCLFYRLRTLCTNRRIKIDRNPFIFLVLRTLAKTMGGGRHPRSRFCRIASLRALPIVLGLPKFAAAVLPATQSGFSESTNVFRPARRLCGGRKLFPGVRWRIFWSNCPD